MRYKAVVVFTLAAAAAAFAQPAPDGYVAVTMVRVKPEKRAAFDALIKKMAAANRQNKSNDWIASEVYYGERNTLYFTSIRQSYADIEKISMAGLAAMTKGLGGEAGMAKLFQDLNDCILSMRSEVRRRRMDLSRNATTDPAAMMKLIGETRWTRTTITRLRPGRTGDYEAVVRDINSALAKASGPRTSTFVSQAASGTQGTVFYSTTLGSSLGAFDAPAGQRPFREVVGEAVFGKLTSVQRDAVLSTENYVARLLPELSNANDEMVKASPDFWRPKPPPPAPKAKATGGQ